MNDRDELARVLSPYDHATANSSVAADVLWSAGWRKMPSREAVIEAMSNLGVDWLYDDASSAADEVLALLDGPTETGEK